MITLKQFLKTCNYRITEGSDFLWKCFGDHAYSLDSWDGDQEGNSFTAVFDTNTQEVFRVEFYNYSKNENHNLTNPSYLVKYNKEQEAHNQLHEDLFDDFTIIEHKTTEAWIKAIKKSMLITKAKPPKSQS